MKINPLSYIWVLLKFQSSLFKTINTVKGVNSVNSNSSVMRITNLLTHQFFLRVFFWPTSDSKNLRNKNQFLWTFIFLWTTSVMKRNWLLCRKKSLEICCMHEKRKKKKKKRKFQKFVWIKPILLFIWKRFSLGSWQYCR